MIGVLAMQNVEVDNKNEHAKVCGTVKAAVLTNDPKCLDLCAVSVYDTKPVHFLTMCNNNIKWVEKERKIYNKNTGKKEKANFLRLNVNDDYNQGMGEVDIADQLRGAREAVRRGQGQHQVPHDAGAALQGCAQRDVRADQGGAGRRVEGGGQREPLRA